MKLLSGGLQGTHPTAAQALEQTFPKAGVLHHFGPVKRGAQSGCVGIGPTQATAHATLNHGRYRVDLQGVGVVFQRQGRAARQTDASVVAIANVFIHAVFDTLHALALFEQLQQQLRRYLDSLRSQQPEWYESLPKY